MVVLVSIVNPQYRRQATSKDGLGMESGVKTLSPSKEGPVKRKSPWGTPTQAPTPCSLAAVMDEELAMKLQTEEEHAFK